MVVTERGGPIGFYRVEVREAAEDPTTHRTATAKNYLVQNVSRASLERPLVHAHVLFLQQAASCISCVITTKPHLCARHSDWLSGRLTDE